MTASINSLSGVIGASIVNQRVSGSNHLGWFASRSAVTAGPRWPLPPVVTTAPTVPLVSLWSRTGIGEQLVVLADLTILRGMARTSNCNIYEDCFIITVCFYSVFCYYQGIFSSQPCLIPTMSPATTRPTAIVNPDFDY